MTQRRPDDNADDNVALVLLQMRHGTPNPEIRVQNESTQAELLDILNRPYGRFNVCPLSLPRPWRPFWKVVLAPSSPSLPPPSPTQQRDSENSSQDTETSGEVPTRTENLSLPAKDDDKQRKTLKKRRKNQSSSRRPSKAKVAKSPGKAVRKQQAFNPLTTDSDHERAGSQKPSRMERFCKTLGLHFQKQLASTGTNTPGDEWRFEELEAYTYHPALRSLDAMEVDKLHDENFAHQAGSTGIEKLPNRGKEGLSAIERKLCGYMGLRFDKYRCVKAQIFFGFACIIEQNFRGCSGALRKCHPFVRGVETYRCMNLGPSQAQMLCRGVDVNITSRVCIQFQKWGWLPDGDIMKEQDRIVTVVESVERLFPQPERCRLLAIASGWDSAMPSPPISSIFITSDDLVANQTGSATNALLCSCPLQTNNSTLHPVVTRFILPPRQAPAGIRKRLDLDGRRDSL